MSRRHCLTQRVRTDFGTIYAQLDVDECGRIAGVSISSHAKHEDSSVNRALSGLSQAFRDLIDAASEK